MFYINFNVSKRKFSNFYKRKFLWTVNKTTTSQTLTAKKIQLTDSTESTKPLHGHTLYLLIYMYACILRASPGSATLWD